MARKLTVSVVMAVVVLVGCAQDPTATDEYTQLEEELAAAEAALADAEGQAAGVTAEVRSVQDEWFAAWNAKDGDAVRSMMVFGGRHYCPATGTNGASGADLVALVEDGSGAVVGRGDDHVVVTEFALNGHDGYHSVFHLRGPERSLRILDHHAYPPSPPSN